MNILFVHERASFTGGVEQNISDIVCGFRERGISCHLAYNPQMAAQQSFLDLFDSHFPCNELATAPTITSTPTLAQVAARTRANCVYIHKVPRVPEEFLLGEIRTVQMVHDHDLYCPRRHKYYVGGSIVCKRPLGLSCYLDGAFIVRDRQTSVGFRYESIRAKHHELRRRQRLDLSIVASQYMRDQLFNNGYDPARIGVLSLAVRDHTAPLRPQLPDTPTILYVGQLIRGKGVDLLLRSLTKLDLPFHAVIVGKGNAERDLRATARQLGLSDRVEFAGWVDNDELHRHYTSCDLVAIPSRWPEPFGMVGLEAMRHSKPVVAFNVGGISDWLRHGETGFLVPPGDVQGYSIALRRLLSNRGLCSALGANGGTIFGNRFRFSNYLNTLEQLLLPLARRTESHDTECDS